MSTIALAHTHNFVTDHLLAQCLARWGCQHRQPAPGARAPWCRWPAMWHRSLFYRGSFPYREGRMKRRVRVQQCKLFESSLEQSVAMDPPLRAQVIELLCALLLEVRAQKQLDQDTMGGNNS